MSAKIHIIRDCSGETWEYRLIDESGDELLSGDGYGTPEEALKDVTAWGNAIVSAISDPDGVQVVGD